VLPPPSAELPLALPAAPSDPNAPLARIAGAAQRNAAWRASVVADVTLAPLRAAADADSVNRQRWPLAFYDADGILRVPRGIAPSSGAVLARDTGSVIIVPRTRVDEVIASYHHGMYGAHFNPTAAIMREWRWPSMQADIERQRAACVQCQAFAATPPRGEASYTGADAERFATVSVDLASMPCSGSGMRYILVAIDSATGVNETAPLPDKTATTTFTAFRDVWLARYGVPRIVVSDNGTEFDGAWHDGAAQFGFEHRRTAAYNPMGNGLAERAVQSIKRSLDKLCVSRDSTDWPLHLAMAVAGVRMHAGHRGASPFALAHGQEPRLPAHARLASGALSAPRTAAMSPEVLVSDVAARTRALLQLAMARRLARQQANAKRISRRHTEELSVGDIVLWQAHTATSKFAARRHWIGPFIIIAESPIAGHFQLGRPDGAYTSQRYVPARQLKLFVGDPYAADSAAILAEPGTRPWLGLDVDRSLLGERFAALDARASAATGGVEGVGGVG
jgi:transposase InsO family protein